APDSPTAREADVESPVVRSLSRLLERGDDGVPLAPSVEERGDRVLVLEDQVGVVAVEPDAAHVGHAGEEDHLSPRLSERGHRLGDAKDVRRGRQVLGVEDSLELIRRRRRVLLLEAHQDGLARVLTEEVPAVLEDLPEVDLLVDEAVMDREDPVDRAAAHVEEPDTALKLLRDPVLLARDHGAPVPRQAVVRPGDGEGCQRSRVRQERHPSVQ
ncbi:hypothetical protein ABE10_00530, partial [Bacillus toyonensis]|nr:hypothetical protein [Bacillus toyonensis]